MEVLGSFGVFRVVLKFYFGSFGCFFGMGLFIDWDVVSCFGWFGIASLEVKKIKEILKEDLKDVEGFKRKLKWCSFNNN